MPVIIDKSILCCSQLTHWKSCIRPSQHMMGKLQEKPLWKMVLVKNYVTFLSSESVVNQHPAKQWIY